jgi:ATP-dependent Clp protease ATP-binding subunit ClpB
VQQLKEEQEQARAEEERATRAGDWEKAAQLKYGKLAEIERNIEAANHDLEAIKSGTLSAQRRDRRGRHREDRGQVDRHSGGPHARRRSAEADPHGSAAA